MKAKLTTFCSFIVLSCTPVLNQPVFTHCAQISIAISCDNSYLGGVSAVSHHVHKAEVDQVGATAHTDDAAFQIGLAPPRCLQRRNNLGVLDITEHTHAHTHKPGSVQCYQHQLAADRDTLSALCS